MMLIEDVIVLEPLEHLLCLPDPATRSPPDYLSRAMEMCSTRTHLSTDSTALPLRTTETHHPYLLQEEHITLLQLRREVQLHHLQFLLTMLQML